jgi:UDP-glucose 4-epimerase
MGNYLVTGGCGFIGIHLVDYLLSKGHQVTVIDNLSSGCKEYLPKEVKLIITDINDESILNTILKEVDGCFNLAAIVSLTESVTQWTKTHKSNQTGLVKIFDVISKLQKKIPIVYASSAAVYGECIKSFMSEDSQPNPISAYGVDKFSCELHAKIAHFIHKIPNIGLRFFNVYGPVKKNNFLFSGVISIFIDLIQKEKELSIYGEGQEIRDFVYVEDVVRALCLSMESLENTPWKFSSNVYNVATGKGTSVLELVKLLEELLGKKTQPLFFPKKDGSIQNSIGDVSKISKDLGFLSEISLEQGLKKTITQIEN